MKKTFKLILSFLDPLFIVRDLNMYIRYKSSTMPWSKVDY